MASILVCVVVQNVSARVNLNHVLKLGVYDKVNRVGECLSKLKLDAKVALFYKLKMIARAVVWGQVKTESCVARATNTSIYLIACILGKLSSSRKKAVKSGYNILTTSFVEFEKKGFSRCLFPIHLDAHLG